MAAAVAARSVLRSASTSIKQSVSRISTGAKPSSTGAAHSPFRIRTQKPQSHRIFRLLLLYAFGFYLYFYLL